MMHVTTYRKSPSADIGAVMRDAFQPWADAYDSWAREAEQIWARTMPQKKCSCCQCESRCGPDDCQCRCCVADSDLLVEARVGERRIIPIVIENRWRREREIELELSSWTKTKDDVEVSGQILSPGTFTIAPCSDAEVILVVEAKGTSDSTSTQRQELGDVSECAVSYADLRIKGCDLRAIRIAVAVLPRSCDAYHVDCCSECC